MELLKMDNIGSWLLNICLKMALTDVQPVIWKDCYVDVIVRHKEQGRSNGNHQKKQFDSTFEEGY